MPRPGASVLVLLLAGAAHCQSSGPALDSETPPLDVTTDSPGKDVKRPPDGPRVEERIADKVRLVDKRPGDAARDTPSVKLDAPSVKLDAKLADAGPPGALPFSCRQTHGDYFEKMAVLPDGSYVVAGYSKDYFVTNKKHALIARFSAANQLVWQKRLTGSKEEEFRGIVAQSDGTLLAVGQTTSFSAVGDADAWVVKLDGAGNVLWQKSYPASKWDESNDIVPAGDGSYLLTGRTSSFGAMDDDGWLLKIAGDGTPQWQRSYGDSSKYAGDRFFTASRLVDGYLVVGKTASFGVTYDDLWVLRVDDTGNIAWQKRYDVSYDDTINAVAPASNGDVFLAGSTLDQVWVLRLKLDGSVVWQKSLDNTLADLDVAFAAAPSGTGVLLAGYTFYTVVYPAPPTYDYDFWLLSLDGNGNLLWNKPVGGTKAEWARTLKATPAGDYLAAGWTASFNGSDYDPASWVVRVSSAGAVTGSCATALTHPSNVKITTYPIKIAATTAVPATTSASPSTTTAVVSQAALTCAASCP